MLNMLAPTNLSSSMFYLAEYLHPSGFWGYSLIGWIDYFLLLLVSLFDRDERDAVFGPIYKVAGIACPFAAFLLITAALYIDFTPTGQEIVMGVQYRYLIPLVPCFCFLALSFKRLRSLCGEQIMSTLFHVVECVATILMVILTFVIQF
jgi:uncharacterized membrane protein